MVRKLKHLEKNEFYKLKCIGQLVEGNNKEKLLEACFLHIENAEAEKDKPIPFYKGTDVIVKINLRNLPNLKVGSIYCDNSLVRNSDAISPRIKLDLNIVEGKEYSLNDVIDIKDTFYFNLGGLLSNKVWIFSNVAGSYIKPHTGESKIDLVIIPTYEIIRFYYSPTSNLVSALFNGGLQTKEIFYPEFSTYIYKSEKEVPFVMLSKKIEDHCAKTVGRIIYDDVAFRMAQKIYDSLHESRGFNRYPSSGFPFGDQTELVVNYERLKVKDDSKLYSKFPLSKRKDNLRIAFVTEILSCNHEFPFNDLEYLRINDARSIIDELNHEVKKLPPRVRKTRDSENENQNSIKNDEISEDGERDSEIDPILDVLTSVIPPFPNAEFDPVRLDKKDQKTTQKLINKLVTDYKKTTRGEASLKDSGILGRDSYQDVPFDGDTQLQFEALVFELSLLNVSIEDCDLNGGNGFSYFPVSNFRGTNRKIYDWCFLVKHSILRKCFLVECRLYNAHKYFYILDVERRMNALKEPTEHNFMVVFERNDGAKISNAELNDFLSHVAMKEAVLKRFREYEEWNLFGVRHKENDSAKRRAERVISKLRL